MSHYSSLYSVLVKSGLRKKLTAADLRAPSIYEHIRDLEMTTYSSPTSEYTNYVFESDDTIKGAVPKQVYMWLMDLTTLSGLAGLGPHGIMFWHGQRVLDSRSCDLDFINGRLFNGVKMMPYACSGHGVYCLFPFRRYVKLDDHVIIPSLSGRYEQIK